MCQGFNLGNQDKNSKAGQKTPEEKKEEEVGRSEEGEIIIRAEVYELGTSPSRGSSEL